MLRYLTDKLRFSVRVYCNRSQMTSQRVKNKKVRRDCCPLHAVTSSVIYYGTHIEKCNLFVLYNKNSNGLSKDFWGMKEEEKIC